MKSKKVLSLLLAAALSFTFVFAACGSDNGAGGKASTAAGSTAAQTTQPAEEEYTGALPLAPEKVTLKFTTHQGTNSSMAPASNELPLYQYLESITNVHIEWETVPYSNYKEVMTARIAAGNELPDILNLTNLGNYQKLAENDVIIPQTQLIEKYGYHIKKFFSENPAYKAMMVSPDNEIYCVEDTVLDSHLSVGVMFNKYALERVGKQVPETVNDFVDVLKALKDGDINGNHKNDEIPLVTSFSPNEQIYLYFLANAFGLEMTWDGRFFTVKDGKVVCQYQLPEFKEFLTFVNRLYKEGLINKDLFTANYDKLIEYTSKGQNGAVIYWTSYAYLFGGASPDNQGDKDGMKEGIFVPAPPLKAASGEQYFTKRQSLNGDGMGITTACPEEKRAIAMKWIDFLFNSPESLQAQSYGVEGMSYKKNSDGTIEKITPEGKDWGSYVTEIGGNQPPRAHQQLLDGWRNSWMPKWLDELDQSYQKYYKDSSIISLKWTTEEEELYNEKLPDLETYINESVTKFILGQESIDKFDSFAKELDNRGINDIKKIYEQRYERQKSISVN